MKNTIKPALLVLCEGNAPVTAGFPAKRTSNTENVSMFYHIRQGYYTGIGAIVRLPSTKQVNVKDRSKTSPIQTDNKAPRFLWFSGSRKWMGPIYISSAVGETNELKLSPAVRLNTIDILTMVPNDSQVISPGVYNSHQSHPCWSRISLLTQYEHDDVIK